MLHVGKGRSMGHGNRRTQGINLAAWNPADKSAQWTLSAANLRAAVTASTGSSGVRGDLARTTGKWYFEFLSNSGLGNVGLARAAQGLESDMYGANTALWVYPQSGSGEGGTWANGAWGGTPLEVGAGQWGAMAFDLDAGLFWVRNETGWEGDPAAGTGGNSMANLAGFALYPFVGTDAGNSADLTANFGGTAFAYAVPTGFTAWEG